jgi:uncharacterized protein YwqG
MHRLTSVEEWKARLISDGFAPGVSAAWAATLRPHVELEPGKSARLDKTTHHESKFGGRPDLPVDLPWPRREAYSFPEAERRWRKKSSELAVPLTFLAQINLAEVARFRLDFDLPDAGLLLFFYDVENQPWGYDVSHAPGSRVVYVPKGTQTKRVPHPEGKTLMTRAIGMTLGSSLLPVLEADDVVSSAHDYVEDDFERILEWSYLDWLRDGGSRIGGYASDKQGPMEPICQSVTQGLLWGEPAGLGERKDVNLAQARADWKLLLQLEEEFLADSISWGDSGRVFFWCRTDDIHAQQLEKTWTILQCN